MIDAKADNDDDLPYLRETYEDMNAGLRKLTGNSLPNQWTALLDREDAVAACYQTSKEQFDTGAPHLVYCPEWRELQSDSADTEDQATMVKKLNDIYKSAENKGGESEVLAVAKWLKLNETLRQNRAWHKIRQKDEKDAVTASKLQVVEMKREIAAFGDSIEKTEKTAQQLRAEMELSLIHI